MPEKVLKKLNEKILPQWKACFFASIILGLFAHLYKIVNWLPNWDSLVFRYDSQNMIGLGRWFLPVVCSFSSFYDLPFLAGILAIIFHGIGATVIAKMFGVQKKITAVLIGGLIATFPQVTSLMMYNYVADGYSIAFLLAVMAAYFMTEEKPKIILGGVLLAFAVGIYQAYVTVTIMLVLLKLMSGIVFGGDDAGATLKKAVKMLISGALGMGLYVLILNVLLKIFSVELSDYQGISDSASMSGINIFASLYVIKESFVKYFFDMTNGVSVHFILNALILAITVICYVKYVVSGKIYKKPLTLVLLLALCPMLIIGSCVLAFVNPWVDYHNLMLMGYAVFYLFFVLLYEQGCECPLKCWTVLSMASLLIANQVVIANVSYHKAQMAYEKSYAVLIRIADRIERTKGAGDCSKLVVIGALENSQDYSVNLAPDITGITDGLIIRRDDENVGQSVLASTLADYCGMDFQFLAGEEKEKIVKSDPVLNMELWPGETSVAVVDDVLVIKLGTEGEF